MQLYTKNQEQRAQMNDIKNFEFGHKVNSGKVEACKDGAVESLGTKKINIKRKPSCLQQDRGNMAQGTVRPQ